METRIAVIAILVKAHSDSIPQINVLLSEYSDFIVGRMGIPYHQKDVNIISVAIDAPQDDISTLSGKLGRLQDVSVKTAYAPQEAE